MKINYYIIILLILIITVSYSEPVHNKIHNIKVYALNPFERGGATGYANMDALISQVKISIRERDINSAAIIRIRNKEDIHKLSDEILKHRQSCSSDSINKPPFCVVIEYFHKKNKHRIAMGDLLDQRIQNEMGYIYPCDSNFYKLIVEYLPKRFMNSDNLYKTIPRIKSCNCDGR
ncbi:MAG: hypothetical protein MUC87_22370 [Bacteroidia bacterium]|jgi:hypothetical protein|nr:hypothetical protein [Bacteroidia bacterium]